MYRTAWCLPCSARSCCTSCGLMILYPYPTSSRSCNSTSSSRRRSMSSSFAQSLVSDGICRMHAFVKPLLDRKILKPLENRKNQYCWPINPSFKKGLRNALTGLYVHRICGKMRHSTDTLPAVGPRTRLACHMSEVQTTLRRMRMSCSITARRYGKCVAALQSRFMVIADMRTVYSQVHGVFRSQTRVGPTQAGSATAPLRERPHVRCVRSALQHRDA